MSFVKMRLPAILIVAWACMFSACKRESELKPGADQSPVLKPNLAVQENRLVFGSQAVFENIVNGKDSATLKSVGDFNSMLKSFAAGQSNGRKKEAVMPIPNAFLAGLVNEDGVLQIGSWIIRIDVKDSLVTVLDESNKDEFYQDLLNQTPQKEIYRFKTTDDVLNLLAEGYTTSPDWGGLPNGRVQLFCCCGAGTRQTEDQQPFPSTGNVSYNMSAYNTYEAYGVYFESSTRIVFKTYPLNPSPDPNSGSYSMRYYWKQKCRNANEGADEFNYRPFTMNWDPDNNLQYSFKHLIYKGSTGLRCIDLSTVYYLGNSTFRPGYIYSCQ